MTRSDEAAIRSIRDRVSRAQRAYTVRLREARDAVQPLAEEGIAGAVELGRAIEAELSHIRYGSAIVEE